MDQLWTEHVTPKNESHKIEELPKKISLAEAEYKQALMQFGGNKKPSLRPVNGADGTEVVMSKALLAESTEPSKLIVEIMAELHNNDFDNDHIEQQTTNKLAKISLLAQKQGQYLASVYNAFINELENLVSHYKEETIQVTEALALEQQARVVFEQTAQEQTHKIEGLELMLQNHDAAGNEWEEKLQQAVRQIGKLESILQTERELRQQAELRTKEIFEKAKKFKVISEQERKQKEIAELQVQEAVGRAKAVMHYFFNSAVDDSVGKIAKAGFKNNNFPEFDGLLLSRQGV